VHREVVAYFKLLFRYLHGGIQEHLRTLR